MNDNFIVMMRGIIKKILFSLSILFFSINNSFALEKIGIITDTLLTPVNYYNAYYRTPEFFAQDVRLQLHKKGVQVLTMDETREALKKSGMTQRDIESLVTLQQGYGVEYETLKKIAKKLGVSKMVLLTMGMDTQRDFLKNTIWNIINSPGQDVVNPTHRVSVYVTFVDVNKENVLWESIYAKNIRNNKMKNLDTTISSNYEGMLRLKEYSKYISPDIAYNVKMKMLNVNYVEPPTAITRANVKQYVKDKHNIGVKKELSEIERQKWDTDKLMMDTGQNIKNTARRVKNGTVTTGNKVKDVFVNIKSKIFRKGKDVIQEL
ncbi:MAG: hypothetical protein IKR34_06220 [Candidatus Gastranaerophilales bacterium]|nr:hypothetical protein [Candidatus Gastranaerophilales bacterium]